MTNIEVERCALENAWQEALSVYSADPLKTVMDYALRGGKYLRGLLLISTSKACGGYWEQAIPPAVAIEMVHAASLAVDDLPALDESKTRRGRPALHCRFGEAHAILAAHALVATAFQVLSTTPLDPQRIVVLVRLLSAAVGGRGMTLGELLDIEKGDRSDYIVDNLKTASLFQAAAETGGVVAGTGDGLLASLRQWGAQIGSCYQTLDDLEDAPVRDDNWFSLRRDFQKNSAATGSIFASVRPELADATPLEQWLDYVSAPQQRW